MSIVGFVGLGTMGGRIAARLLASGYQVHATNRTVAKAQPLIDRGLRWHATPRQVAAAADVVMSMVSDDAALEAITAGPDGILAGLTPGKVYIDMSTVSPEASIAIAERVQSIGASDARRSGLGQRSAGRDRNADDHGRRPGGGLPARRTTAARAGPDRDPRRRERPGPAAQAGDQHQPRGPDAGLQRRAAAGRARRHRAAARRAGHERELDRLTDAPGARPPAARPAGERVVRRRG